MKKFALLTVLALSFFVQKAFAQTSAREPGPVEKKITDSICNCVSKLDLSKLTTKEEATEAYTQCILKHADLLADLAKERNVDLSDNKAMEAVGVDIAMSLLKQDCKGFKDLALLLGGNDAGNSDNSGEISTATGTFKRIDNKGFNYFVITDREQKERSFIWYRQFPGSEKFMTNSAAYAGKKMIIKYREVEVYLPQAKGYYNVKEVTAITVL